MGKQGKKWEDRKIRGNGKLEKTRKLIVDRLKSFVAELLWENGKI